MAVLVDDVGSFPLPLRVGRKLFDEAYVRARRAIGAGKGIATDSFLQESFYSVVIESFRMKYAAGLDVVNYPQHYDMHRQLTDVITLAMEKGTYVVDEKDAIIPEVFVIGEEARRLYEEFGKKIRLRVCVVGPLELYLKLVGTIPYRDILLMLAETAKRFAENSILNSKYVKTEVVSLDEPSFGFLNVSADKDVILDVLKKAFSFTGATKQIHLHSSLKATDVLNVEGLDVVSLEFGASPKNLDCLSKKKLNEADKYVRVGVTRTDVDSIRAELYDRGIEKPAVDQLVEPEETMRKRFNVANEKFGERLLFVGPDCGLGGWPSQDAAELLLKRTVDAVKKAQNALVI
jgi:5-methyltetrahydropteroyltriglutamate--homocysteine methyltransferase